MSIDKIGSVNNMNDYSKINSSSKAKKVVTSDSVNISNQAAELSENKRIMNMIKEAPDVRADRVKELKAKMEDPNYIDKNMVNFVADKILDNLR